MPRWRTHRRRARLHRRRSIIDSAQAGERIKTDRRDAINLAKLHWAGELTPVWVPDAAHEAIRNLVRPRLAAVRTTRQPRQQPSGFLLRHGHHYNRMAWTPMHRRWLAGLSFEQAVHHIVLEDCVAGWATATSPAPGASSVATASAVRTPCR
jgi:transposase